ncbi:uncharacterized protein LOC125646852 [Ostrea edulis]|uniref:uncharacterized protein LOC125646852 n=1 Tax=Ostrea edulis TaxID=37623 RepID=UPI0024AED2A0|nr:uncharacterized protein LOC125646852 [Ostrea edulis]
MSNGRKYEVNGSDVNGQCRIQPTPCLWITPPAFGQQPITNGFPISNSTNVVASNNVATPVVIYRGRDWLVPAVLSCLFCFWPAGLCAIVAAVNARSRYEVGDHVGGQSSATTAKILTLISFGVGLVYLILLAVMYFTVWRFEKDRFGFTTKDPFDIFEFTTKNPWDI